MLTAQQGTVRLAHHSTEGRAVAPEVTEDETRTARIADETIQVTLHRDIITLTNQ